MSLEKIELPVSMQMFLDRGSRYHKWYLMVPGIILSVTHALSVFMYTPTTW